MARAARQRHVPRLRAVRRARFGVVFHVSRRRPVCGGDADGAQLGRIWRLVRDDLARLYERQLHRLAAVAAPRRRCHVHGRHRVPVDRRRPHRRVGRDHAGGRTGDHFPAAAGDLLRQRLAAAERDCRRHQRAPAGRRRRRRHDRLHPDGGWRGLDANRLDRARRQQQRHADGLDAGDRGGGDGRGLWRAGGALAADQLQPLVFGKHLYAVLFGFGQFRAGAGARDHVVGLLRHRAGGLGAQALGRGLGLLARHLLQAACKHHGLAGDRAVGLRLFGVEDFYLFGQPLDDAAVVAFAEISLDAFDHRFADLVERVHLGDGFFVALGHFHASLVERLPGAIAARQRQRRGLADLTDAERKDETLERNLPPLFDRGEQIAHRGLAIALDLFELDLVVARIEREDVGGFRHPLLLEEQFDLLLAQALDVEGAARGEQLEVLYFLVWAGELAGAAPARALLAGGGFLAHDIGVQIARAFLREVIGPGVLWPFVEHHVDHLRDHVAGALDDDGIADADVAAIAQRLAVAADALDVVLVVQGDVLHDDAADAERLQLADRRERAGAADLDFDVLEHGGGALGRKLVRDRPARATRDEAEPLLPVEAVDLVDDAVDVVIELGAGLLDLAVEGEQVLDRMADLGERIGLEAATGEPFDHAGLRVGRHLAHLPPRISKEAERTRGGDARVLLAQRAGGRITRIGEDLLVRRLLPFVEFEEIGLGYVDLAAHLADFRNAAHLELKRHVLQRADIGGDVLAFAAVATGGRGAERG